MCEWYGITSLIVDMYFEKCILTLSKHIKKNTEFTYIFRSGGIDNK